MTQISLSQTNSHYKKHESPLALRNFFFLYSRLAIFALKTSKMRFTIFISFLLTFLGELNIVSGGGQIALRPRPKDPILSRSTASDGSMFDPTEEESFYVSGGDIE